MIYQQIPVPAWSKAEVYGCSISGIMCSKSTGARMSLFLNVVCCQVEVSATDRSLVYSSPTEYWNTQGGGAAGL